jgi:hypothetical protein
MISDLAIGGGISACLAISSYLVVKVLDTDKALAAHAAADSELFKSIALQLAAQLITTGEIKSNQRDQSQKLDRLIEHMLDHP